jgi:hypothetical protein
LPFLPLSPSGKHHTDTFDSDDDDDDDDDDGHEERGKPEFKKLYKTTYFDTPTLIPVPYGNWGPSAR